MFRHRLQESSAGGVNTSKGKRIIAVATFIRALRFDIRKGMKLQGEHTQVDTGGEFLPDYLYTRLKHERFRENWCRTVGLDTRIDWHRKIFYCLCSVSVNTFRSYVSHWNTILGAGFPVTPRGYGIVLPRGSQWGVTAKYRF